MQVCHTRMLNFLCRCIVAVLLLMSTNGYAQIQYFNPIELLDGKKKATIPFRYIHNFIIVEARIYGIIPLQFIFDTGAEHIILFKREYTDLLQVPYDRRIPVLGSDMSREIFALIARNGVIEVNGLAPQPHDILVLEEDYFSLDEMIGSPVAGLIGGGFFRNLIINIDYKRRQITLYDPATFEPPDDYISLPIKIKTNKPYIMAEASLNDGSPVQVDLLVDTGAGVPLLLHNNSHPSLHLPDHYIKGKLGIGLGGYLEGYIGRIQKLSLGSIEFPGVLTSFQNVDENWLQDKDKYRNGILGNNLLSRFDVFMDYNRGQLMLKPYKAKQEPFVMDRSGLVLFAFGTGFNQFAVRDILSDSPAQEADFQVNDVLTRIQGTAAKYYTLDDINRVLQKKAGKKLKLQILRGKELMRKELTLRDLI
ncbi:MAG TPA: aspartyl protease family protein [Saprospiraceae bacterium]|nr:aspartyl protease family protein [Saprospiraceae bacterium]